jgi:ketosteroid isomerase-like protein
VTARPQTVLDQELGRFLDRYAALYNRQAYAELLEMWDTGDPDVFYMAEEVDPPMHGWQTIKAYFDRPGSLAGIRNEYSEVRARHLTPDLALATYKLRFDLAVTGMKPLSSFDRVVAVFRRCAGEWKLLAYAEAPQAPLTMVRRLAQNSKTLGPAEQRALLKTVQTLLEDTVPADFEQWLKTQA